jgi:hypothetical protein
MNLADWKLYAFVLWPCGDKTIHEVIYFKTSFIPYVYCLKTNYGPIWKNGGQIAMLRYAPDRLCGKAGFSDGWDGESEC